MMASMLPTMIGLNEATQGTRDQEENRKNSARKQRCHLVATCALSQGTESQRAQVQNARVYVGQDGKVSIVMHMKQRKRKQTKKKNLTNQLFRRSSISPRNPAPRCLPSMVASTPTRISPRTIHPVW
jgi:hypothetical protein